MGPANLEIAQLLFDVGNPRITKAVSQRDALQKVIADQGEKLVVLAESIVSDGLNPTERLLVIAGRDKDEFVVIEGNRRLAALKLLANVALLDELEIRPYLKKTFEELSRQFDRASIEPVACYEVLNRAAGKAWIQLRHTGENGGKGVVSWSGVAAARFRGDDPALQALAFVKEHGGLADEQLTLLDERFPITTLDRLLSSSEVRQRLGFTVKAGKLVTGLPARELLKPLRKVVLDLAEKRLRVSSVMNKTQQGRYIDEFTKAELPDVRKSGDLRAVDSFDKAELPAAKASPSRRRKPEDLATRKTLVPRRNRVNVVDNRVAMIFRELTRLKVDDAPNAIAVLFRVFLELSVDHYMEASRMPSKYRDEKGQLQNKALKTKVKDVVSALIAAGNDRKEFDAVLRALSVAHSPMHIDLLNAYVHNRFTTPKSRDLIASWDESQRFFERIWP